MNKKLNYIIGLLALGIVIFNNGIQLSNAIKDNYYYTSGLLIALIASVSYGIINIK